MDVALASSISELKLIGISASLITSLTQSNLMKPLILIFFAAASQLDAGVILILSGMSDPNHFSHIIYSPPEVSIHVREDK